MFWSSALTGERVAFVTLRAVLPERLDVVPAKRIVELRARHGGARQAFHDYVDLVRQSLASGDIRDPAAFDEHIRLEYERRLKPELVDLQKGLRSLGLSTFLGSFGVAITLPVGAFLAPLSPAAAIGSAVASLGVAALSHKHREEAGGLVRKSPASFLFVTEQLRPRTFGQRLAESVRRFSLGV